MLNNLVLNREDNIKDLGVIFTSDLSFTCHIENVCNKAMKLLGFMFHTLKDFKNIFVLKNVYCVLVRSTLEYACTVWSPHYGIHIETIEKVQKRFLRHIAYKLLIPSDLINYNELLLLLNLPSLEQRRRNYDLCLLFKILNNLIDCPELLHAIGLHVPSRQTRHTQLFNVGYHRTNYGHFGPIERICREANDLAHSLDFFNTPLKKFKDQVKRL